jgi:hypothetical protein
VAEAIRIEGLKEFRAGLKRMDKDLPKGIRLALNSVVDIVVDDARPRIPRRSGRAAASLKSQSTQNKARIKAGGSRARYFPWLDFGGRTGPGRSVVRPFFKKGRYVWLSFADKRVEVTKALDSALADVARGAGLDVTRG